MRQPAIAKRELTTSFGDIAYLERGPTDAPPVLFVHGIPTSGYLWRHVLDVLGADFRCYAPDLMGLGDTQVSADASFDMDAQAEMLIGFMSALGHERFGLVCHDQGGAAAQLIAARFPERVASFVLTNCVCYDNWPVPVIRRLQRMSRWPVVPELLSRTGLSEWLETSTRWSAFRRGVYSPDALTADAIREYLRPMRTSRRGRERFRAFLLAGDPAYTMRAVDGLRRFDAPTLVVWGADDVYLSPSWGRKLADDIPGCKDMVLIPFCGHFWQEERPHEFAAVIGRFLAEHLQGGRHVKLPVVTGGN